MRRTAVLTILWLTLASLALLPASSAIAGDPAPPILLALPNNVPAAERFGIGVNTDFGNADKCNISQFNVGWYSDWGFSANPSRPGGLNYVQIIYVREDKYPPNWNAVANAIAANPGSLWIVGNEPEALFQGNRTPSEYAAIYHEAYAFIKAHDPTAAVAIGGVVQPSPLRLRWLDEVLAAYRGSYGVKMPVDVWNTHVQILRERGQASDCEGRQGCFGAYVPAGLSDVTDGLFSEDGYPDDLALWKNADPGEFQHMVVAFRTWMKDNGEQDKPLIISEYGVLQPSDFLYRCPDPNDCDYDLEYAFAQGQIRVSTFMTETFDYLVSASSSELGYSTDGNRLVQRWLWYSLNNRMATTDQLLEGDFNGSLLYHEPPYGLTVFGETFKTYTDPLPQSFLDLAPRDLVVTPALRPSAGGITVTAFVTVANLGTASASSVRVSFYEGTAPVTSTLVAQLTIPTVPARFSGTATITATWTAAAMNPSLPSPQVFVIVDPQAQLPDTDRANNTTVVTVPLRRLHMPVIRRAP